ncbi:MAG: ABC transporter permease subunit [Actinobacteria bacterium]|nr:ABC transporter permease subunit [Actinomycetota bacterium]MSY87986.1 ABC transporter permease subunit [Actinomycetota bacterium]MTA51252.1 ABC transporter permease subunit [Actinomycetota bacterium]
MMSIEIVDGASASEPVLGADEELKGRSPRELAWRRFRRNKVGIIAGVFTLGTLLSSLFAPFICKVLGLDPNELHLDQINVSTGLPKAYLGGISWEHPLGLLPGTGRDLLSQLLYGSRISFLVMILATVATLFVGLLAGITGGYLKGRVDATLGRVTDFLLAFPSFFMIVALAEPLVDRIQRLGIAHGNSARILFLIIILTFFGWTGFSRLIRSQVLSLSERDFVTAATALGASRTRIIFQELIPNLWAPVIVVLSLSLPGYLTAESVFSFLGIGVQPPGFTWGLLISNSTQYVTNMPSFFLIATVSLVLVVLAFNLLGDAVRDALDPKADK